MQLRAHDALVWEPIAVAGTRPSTMAMLGVSYWYVIAAFPLSIVPAMLTLNPLWFIATFIVLVLLARVATANNANRPRELWLALTSGSFWADRSAWGGERIDLASARRPEARP